MQNFEEKGQSKGANKSLEEKFLKFYYKEVNIRVRIIYILNKKKSQF